MLDLELDREGPPPRDAATVILLRDTPGGPEVFCVERNRKSGFLGGAIVFPGGKVDEADRDPAWTRLATQPAQEELRAFAVAACRESLEEAALLPVAGGALSDAEVVALRERLARGEERLAGFLEARGLRLDLAALEPFARWVTPAAESRRYDTRFFLAVAPVGQRGAHDTHETMASFWARPAEVLARFAAGELQLAPPTHRTLELLSAKASVEALLAGARANSQAPICPRLVTHADEAGSTLALVLPGDPEHPVAEVRVPGASRYVLRGERWLPKSTE